ncbi:hypothetical protein I4U23_010001 [Adineta vaga]|nr:hypothetical protein I4U23_010001 [Adineta vaga]
MLNRSTFFIEPGLSYEKCQKILFPLISQSSLLLSSIRRIHLDGTNSSSFDLINERLYDNERKSCRFSNLKSLILTRCLLIESLTDTLSFLIKYQLDELTLIFDKQMIYSLRCTGDMSTMEFEKEKLIKIFQELIEIIFSNQCQLTSLKLDFVYENYSLKFHQCLKSHSSNLISISNQIFCPKLRYLHLHIQYTFILENLIDYVPFLEELSLIFHRSLEIHPRSPLDIKTLIETNGNWFKKVSKLKYFSLKSVLRDNVEFAYLKWLLNNLNHIEKLSIHLQSLNDFKTNEIIWNSIIDANFIYKYCLPDEIIHLKQFHFYIISNYESIKKTTEEIIHSFRIHPVFLINHQWTNVKCLFDPILSYQHLCSSPYSIYERKFTHNSIHVPKLFNYTNIRYVWFDFDSSDHLCLEQFNELFPNSFCIKVNMEQMFYSRRYSDLLHSRLAVYYNIQSYLLIKSTNIEPYRLTHNQLHNVTRLDFYPYTGRPSELLARLISMPIQLKSLRIQKFEWLIHMIQYASNELKQNALNNVEYVEFSIPSCNMGSNERLHIGKNLVPFLSIYMPHLRTLRLWRPDDFPWTSIRPMYTPNRVCFSQTMMLRWFQSLRKSVDSINQHVFVFQQDLNELIEQLDKFVFLEILGEIYKEKLEPYRSMVQRNFPNSRSHVDISRFRLWI